MSVEVTGYDNRGDSEVAYGYVYFTDGRRALYTSEHGVSLEYGGWGGIYVEHVRAATDYLKEKGIL